MHWTLRVSGMSKDAPDPRALEDWESAFQYPIPTVRAAEKRLHQILNENHDKLRNIVGSVGHDSHDLVVTNSNSRY